MGGRGPSTPFSSIVPGTVAESWIVDGTAGTQLALHTGWDPDVPVA